MPEQRRLRSVSQALLLDLLSAELADWQQHSGRTAAVVVDLGGGTGGIATVLAERGHDVTVIDPSPDALASLVRRTAEGGLSDRIRGVQGDASDVVDLVGADAADVVICHRTLEVVDSPAEALASMATVLRPGGALSLVVSQRPAAVLSQALAGHLALARRTLADPQRFDHQQVAELVTAAGFEIVSMHGLGAIADHVSEAILESEAANYAELYALENEISQDPAFRAVAPQVHVFARMPEQSA